MNTTKHDREEAVAGQVDCRVRPVAAHMVTSDGSKHHLRFDVREVEMTAKRMQQGCTLLYGQDAVDRLLMALRTVKAGAGNAEFVYQTARSVLDEFGPNVF
jgi:hypothetical protein